MHCQFGWLLYGLGFGGPKRSISKNKFNIWQHQKIWFVQSGWKSNQTDEEATKSKDNGWW